MPSTPLILSAADVSMRRILACGIGLVSDLQNTMPSARKSSAYLARPVTLAWTSTGTKFLPMRLYAISSLPGCAHDGFEVVVVGTAPADVAGRGAARHVRQHLPVRCLRPLPQSRHARIQGGLRWRTTSLARTSSPLTSTPRSPAAPNTRKISA